MRNFVGIPQSLTRLLTEKHLKPGRWQHRYWEPEFKFEVQINYPAASGRGIRKTSPTIFCHSCAPERSDEMPEGCKVPLGWMPESSRYLLPLDSGIHRSDDIRCQQRGIKP